MEDVKKYFKENSQNTLKDNYIKACSDEVFQNYVHQLPIKEEVLVKYGYSLNSRAEEIPVSVFAEIANSLAD